ncbi:hypothetical protein AALO_G00092060 [Alosa alosa]|uniref:Uncharacterized protein n=1 Tax=Alosa alosa TaxID=278164 RepID=A0AAV6GRU8_9TELE|nr:hypothetical protein AALO_G00092060 [Alosa alosa]
MSGFTESTPLPMPVKEIKEEEFDDFLQEYMFADQEVKGNLGLDYDCKTETHTSPTFNCKEEQSPVMEIKQEEESDLKEDCQKDSFCKGEMRHTGEKCSDVERPSVVCESYGNTKGFTEENIEL